jgi:Adenylate cyclase, family 3 (some proteins contain HAMP domain)
MVRVNAMMCASGLPTLRMRVGICTGPVLAGSLGSAERMKYTTLGDTVNTAARLESFSKELDLRHLADATCRILISESTLRLLGDRFETLRVGELELKGKQEKISAHCLLAPRTHAPEKI